MRAGGGGEDPNKSHTDSDNDDDGYGRRTILVADENVLKYPGESGFSNALGRTFQSTESTALEKTLELKHKLRQATGYDFWQILVEGMTATMGAQYAFVAKRVLYSDDDAAVEMPPLGEPGSCLMGLAFYFNDHNGRSKLVRDYKYKVYGCPCQWMRHNKVLVIPSGLSNLTPDNPNASALPIPPEGYLAVPLYHAGQCFAHFGVMFTAEALENRKLGWGMMEMFLHTLEDQVCERIINGQGPRVGMPPESDVIPQQKATISPPGISSMRPYARRLSHELRTPMQGVVGMLDVMYASVLEASETTRWGWPDPRQVKDVINDLRASIEVAQDSSKRAVDAADNMVHAYDFDMRVPSTPFLGTGPTSVPLQEHEGQASHILIDSSKASRTLGLSRVPKRRRDSEDPTMNASPHKILHVDSDGKTQLNFKPVRLRELLHQVIHESLRSGGRPDYIRSVETERGEQIFVETRASDGVAVEKRTLIEIVTSVEEGVPEIMTDAAALARLLSSIVHNSVKFTFQGRISVTVAIVDTHQVLFTVSDTGAGIPVDFIPDLFKAFAREDVSLTRHRDGLGLGLMVAKGIARRLGGDLWCERTSTNGESQGTEFRARLPITPPTPALALPAETLSHEMAAGVISAIAYRKASPPCPDPARLGPVARPRTEYRKAMTFDPDLGKKLPLRILVVEDNRINRNLLCSMLTRLGYVGVKEARDGVEAVETFSSRLGKREGECFDLVLMDLWMPRMDGFEATEQILKLVKDRGDGNSEDVTVLAVSADATEIARAKAAEKGVRGFVGKPFGMAELGKALWEFCGRDKEIHDNYTPKVSAGY